MKTCVKWFEIPAVNMERAVDFYNTVFDISLNVCVCNEEQMAFFPENEMGIGGSISLAEGFNPSNHGAVIYFDVSSPLETVLNRVTHNGGDILLDRMKIDAEGRGWFAWIKDTEGNRIGLYSDT